MSRNKITFIIVLIPAFLFLQGCQDNIILPDTVNQLQAPRLLYPPDDTTDVDIPMTFSWEGSRNIINYVLQISIDSLFDSIAYSHHGRTTIIKDVIGLNNQTKYFWRVNAINGYGEFHWSNVWKFTTGKFCNGTPIVEYSGKIYKTVQIGNQCWFRENLDVGILVKGSDYQLNNGIIEKYCYYDSIENCNIYGGLYLWNEAMQYSTIEGSQGICPSGWHIPTYYEFQICSTTVGGDGNALKTVGQGSGLGAGTNTSGFSLLLAGYRTLSGTFYGMGGHTILWSSTISIDNLSYYFSLNRDYYLIYTGNYYRSDGYSIRCLKD